MNFLVPICSFDTTLSTFRNQFNIIQIQIELGWLRHSAVRPLKVSAFTITVRHTMSHIT